MAIKNEALRSRFSTLWHCRVIRTHKWVTIIDKATLTHGQFLGQFVSLGMNVTGQHTECRLCGRKK